LRYPQQIRGYVWVIHGRMTVMALQLHRGRSAV